MRTKSATWFGMVVVGGLFAASNALALPGLPAEFKIKFENFEYFNPAIALGQTADGVEDNWGIFRVTTIMDTAPATSVDVWTSATSNYEITGMFYGLDVAAVAAAGFAGFDVGFVGGALDLYIQDKTALGYTAFDKTLGLGGRTGLNSYTGVTDGTMLAHSVFVPGIVPTIPALTNLSSVTALTSPLSGNGTGYLNVIPGTGDWSDVIVPGPGNKDLFLSFNFTTNNVPGDWSVVSDDPVTGSAVPEPGTMVLLGSGLLGLAGLARRRTK